MKSTKIKKIGTLKLAFFFIIGALWFFALYNTPNILNILSLKFVHPVTTSFMRYKSINYPTERIKYNWVSDEKISKSLKMAVVIAEDDRFYEHMGLDWKAIQRAFEINWKRKSFDFGASTITQQLIKNLYLSPSKDPMRKFREMVLAYFIDAYLSKERILEIYLNVVEWGPNIYGAEAASKYYFKKSAKNLSPREAAFLASILPNPVGRGKNGYHLTSRAQSILRRIQ